MDQKWTLSEIAGKTGARLVPESAGEIPVTGFTTLENAASRDISFIASEKFKKQAADTEAAAILAPDGIEIEGKNLLLVPNVWKAVITLLGMFFPEPEPDGKRHPTAIVSDIARIGQNVTIGPFTVIEEGAWIGDNTLIGALCYIGRNVKIGRDALLHPRATILHNCELGDRVICHSGSVIGSDGFKFELLDGLPTKIPQVGRVIVEDDVEIGANTCIDRASFTETRIGRGTKLDNLIQIAHNVELGPYCMIASQTGVAGSTKIGSGCIFGGQCGIRDNVTIGDGVMIGARSGARKDTPSGARLFGFLGQPAKEAFEREALLNRLPRLVKKIRTLEKRLKALEEPGKS